MLAIAIARIWTSLAVSRGGLSGPQLNKYLEKMGYARARVRMQTIVMLDINHLTSSHLISESIGSSGLREIGYSANGDGWIH